jgi:malate dehydrogenase
MSAKAPLRVAVTGAAGNIAYSLIWRIANGECFGADQPVILSLLEITPALTKLQGTVMEIVDSAFPLVHGVDATDDAGKAFDGADAVFLVGSRPRTAEMTRADLIAANGRIFVGQGQALNRANRDVKVLAVGNPCNTNCLIANHHAADIPSTQFTAMTRLDQNRAAGQLAERAGVPVAGVRDVVIWGNHGDTMYPDTSWASIDGKPVRDLFPESWIRGEFLKKVAMRGKAIIEARGLSSAASAASSAIDHMRDWHLGSDGRIVNMAIVSNGEYGVPKGLVFSMPVRCAGGSYTVIEGLDVDDFGRQHIQANIDALLAEREAVQDLLT